MFWIAQQLYEGFVVEMGECIVELGTREALRSEASLCSFVVRVE